MACSGGFSVQRPERRGVSTPAAYRGLPERRQSFCRFGAFHPYRLAPGNPTRLLFLPDALTRQQQPDTAQGDDVAGVKVGIIGMSTALAGELGL